MTKPTNGRWGQIRDQVVSTPELKERYEHTKRAVVITRRILMQIDAERERAGLSKAELARRIGTSPSVVRRIFSSKAGNPTLRTMLGMLDVLGIDLQLRPMKQHRRSTLVADERPGATRRGAAL
ncbi:MAG: XRE family transcriptional regulator [Chloroflexota bacterium]|nr:MAG: XRE family transcriptional regulator [Chloroflexota bacterium]